MNTLDRQLKEWQMRLNEIVVIYFNLPEEIDDGVAILNSLIKRSLSLHVSQCVALP